MSDLTKHDSQFVEDIDGAFHQLFRSAGVAIDQNGIEKIREISTRLARAIEHRGEVKAIEVIRVLQVSVTNAFKALESDLIARNVEVDDRMAAMQAQIDKLTDPTLRGNRK
jgi:chorismate mutase